MYRLRGKSLPPRPALWCSSDTGAFHKGGFVLIIKNAIRCNICGDEIESKHRHDYVQCKCGACAVDGGHDYLRRCARDENCFTDISIIEQQKQDQR